MFDDPKKDLKWLEQQLLAVEAPQEDHIDLDALLADEDLFEEDPLETQLREARMLLRDASARNWVGDFSYPEEAEEEPEEQIAPPPKESRKEKKQKKEKGIGGLVFLACLETLGIVAVLLWWALWLL